jgi:hypothetical protein
LEELCDLVWLGFSIARLQAQRPRRLRMAIYVVTAADSPQLKSKRLDQTAELRESPTFRTSPAVIRAMSAASRERATLTRAIPPI